MSWLLRLACCVLLGAAASGCVAVGAIAYKLAPPPKVPAEFKPAQQKTLVLVENFQNPDAVSVYAERLDRDIARQFSEHKVAPMVDPQQLLDLRSNRGRAFDKMDIPTIARMLGAKQVVYVDLVQFSIDPPAGSETLKGNARALVKVVDDKGRTLWPRDSSVGREVKYETPYLRPGEGVDANAAQEQVYEKLADHISRLFYDWSSEQVDGSEPEIQN